MDMATTINTKALINELEWVDRFTEKKTTIPILKTVLLESSGGTLKLTATDLETSGITTVPVSGDQFRTCVPVTRLVKYLKKLGAAQITASVDESFALTIQGHDDDSVTIPGMSPESFPDLPDMPESGVTLGGLKTAIPRVLISVSREESRFKLNGALLEHRAGATKLISTDGNRLSLTEIQGSFPDNYKAIIPQAALKELVRICSDEPVGFSQAENFIGFTVGNRTIVSRKITGNFPDYERVMPKSQESVEISTWDLQGVLDRVSLFADERSHATNWSIDHAVLTVSSGNSDNGRAVGSIQLPTNGVSWGNGFNQAFVSEGLKHMPEHCRFGFSQIGLKESHKAAQFTVPGFTYVVMPMRAGNK